MLRVINPIRPIFPAWFKNGPKGVLELHGCPVVHACPGLTQQHALHGSSHSAGGRVTFCRAPRDRRGRQVLRRSRTSRTRCASC